MNNQQKYIPFLSAGEAAFHIDMSNVLSTQIKARILELEGSDNKFNELLQRYVTESLTVLIDGYVNLLESINRGCLK